MELTRDALVQALATRPRQFPDRGERWAAVLALFTPGPTLWLMRRATVVGDPWSGHLALPGGRREADDADLLQTALRETWEEFGLELGRDEVLGGLDDARVVPQPDLIVRPFVAWREVPPVLSPNHEVAAVHTVALADLLNGRGRGVFEHVHEDRRYTLPSVEVQGHRLWGLTLRIVDDLLHRIDGGGRGLARTG